MLRQIRLLLGISIFWLALSMLQDGINTLVLPLQLSSLGGKGTQATFLGLLTFVGLLGGALVQPVAGVLSDRFKPVLGRRGFIGIGLFLSLASLGMLAIFQNLAGVAIAYLAVQVSASFAQAGQQGLIPDLVEDRRRGPAGQGDHQCNHPMLGPDEKIYFGAGCATNGGVVGADNFGFEWLPKFPEFCDVSAKDVTL